MTTLLGTNNYKANFNISPIIEIGPTTDNNLEHNIIKAFVLGVTAQPEDLRLFEIVFSG